MEKLIGRKTEIAELLRCYSNDRSEFVMVYGRRRIGKTFLINQVFKDKMAFSYTGAHRQNASQQLQNFALELKKHSKSPFSLAPKNWSEAFTMLADYLEASPQKERKVIFFDEMPWIDTPHSDFVNALEYFWNAWAARRDDIMLVACGSATSWMVDKLIKNQGGLHNRITSRIYLRPFMLSECKEYLYNARCQWDDYQIAQCYMAIGGIPFYLSLLDSTKSLAQNIDELFFKKGGRLEGEFDELYNVLFNDAEKYIQIVEALAEKAEGLTRQEIMEHTRLQGGGLTRMIENLERCDFISAYTKFGSKKKGTIYRLIDFYTLYYLRFISKAHGHDEHFWTHHIDTPQITTWQGFAFENLCLVHLNQIKNRLGISGMATYASSWRSTSSDQKAQIDLVIERSDRIINLCEMKFSKEPYIITKDYENRLRNRMAIFRAETKTRKSLAITFVTTFGVLRNTHAGIVQSEVRLEDLFI